MTKAPKIDTSRETLKMHLYRLQTKGGATDKVKAAEIIQALLDEREIFAAQSAAAVEIERDLADQLAAALLEAAKLLPRDLRLNRGLREKINTALFAYEWGRSAATADITALDARDLRVRREVWEEAAKVAHKALWPLNLQSDWTEYAHHMAEAADRARQAILDEAAARASKDAGKDRR